MSSHTLEAEASMASTVLLVISKGTNDGLVALGAGGWTKKVLNHL